MMCAEQNEYINALSKLSQGNVRYAVIGTFGLLAHGFSVDGYTVSDCDIIVDSSGTHLQQAWQILKDDGWETFLWDVLITEFPSQESLKNKYYIRARRGHTTIDICYEHDSIDYAEWLERRRRIGEIYVADSADIIELKRTNDREKDRALLAKLNLRT